VVQHAFLNSNNIFPATAIGDWSGFTITGRPAPPGRQVVHSTMALSRSSCLLWAIGYHTSPPSCQHLRVMVYDLPPSAGASTLRGGRVSFSCMTCCASCYRGPSHPVLLLPPAGARPIYPLFRLDYIATVADQSGAGPAGAAIKVGTWPTQYWALLALACLR
jgi:hypothetical protein